MTDIELEQARQASIREVQEKTNRWLREQGFWFLGQNKADLMKRLAEFRKTSVPKPMGRDWARILKSKILDGKRVPPVVEEFANEALRLNVFREEEAA